MKLWEKTLVKLADEWPRIRSKVLTFIICAVALGVFDAKHPPFYFLNSVAAFLSSTLPAWINTYIPILSGDGIYQAILFSVSAVLTFWALYDSKFSWPRRMLNLLMIVPGAILLDYVSATITADRFLAFTLPSADYTWRTGLYHKTIFSGVASWADAPSKMLPGAIQGYNLLVLLTIAFVAIQFAIMVYKIKNTSK